MRHTPPIQGPLSWDWSKTRNYLPGRTFLLVVFIIVVLLYLPLTRSILTKVWNFFHWDPWSQEQTVVVEESIDKPVLVQPKKNLEEHLGLNGKFEEVRRWKIKVPDSPDGTTPTSGFGIVIPPESNNDVRIDGRILHPTSSNPNFYLVSTTLTAEQAENNSTTEESLLASPLGRLPFQNTLYNSSPLAYAVRTQGFTSQGESVGFNGEAIIQRSWVWNNSRTGSQPLEWRQWKVELNRAEGASFVIPEYGWKHIWIVPVDDPEFLPEVLGTPVPVDGFSQEDLESLYVTTYQDLIMRGSSREEATQAIQNIQTTLLENLATNVDIANPHGPFITIDGVAESLEDAITWSFTRDDLQGKKITLGININRHEKVPEPLKVIVGVSRCD